MVTSPPVYMPPGGCGAIAAMARLIRKLNARIAHGNATYVMRSTRW